MNSEQFIEYIKNPSAIDAQATAELEKLLVQYPYFQTAHLLYIKGLKNNKSIYFNDSLKIAATYSGSREILYKLLHDIQDTVPEIVVEPSNNSERTTTTPEAEATPSEEPIAEVATIEQPEIATPAILDENLSTENANEQRSLEPELSATPALPVELLPQDSPNEQHNIKTVEEDNSLLLDEKPVEKELSLAEQILLKIQKQKEQQSLKELQNAGNTQSAEQENPLPHVAPTTTTADKNSDLIEFDFTTPTAPIAEAKPQEALLYTQEYAAATYNIAAEEYKPQTDAKKNNADNLIDKFLAKEHSIKPNFDKSIDNQSDISSESIKEQEFLSETLAEIYVKQQNFDKAIKIYKKLSLKYPQKSVYFANKISDIEKNIKK